MPDGQTILWLVLAALVLAFAAGAILAWLITRPEARNLRASRDAWRDAYREDIKSATIRSGAGAQKALGDSLKGLGVTVKNASSELVRLAEENQRLRGERDEYRQTLRGAAMELDGIYDAFGVGEDALHLINDALGEDDA